MADVEHQAEREVKLGAWPGFRLPDLGDLADWVAEAEPGEHLLDATYMDAADLRLIRAGVTLRHRTGEGGQDGRWTLKLPAASKLSPGKSDPALDRTEITFDAPGGVVPDPLQAAVAGLLRREPLKPVARLRTERRVVSLRDGGGRRVGEVADDEVTVFDGERAALKFREIEIEAMPGAPSSLLDLVVERLRSAGAGEPDPTPKLVRALGPDALAPPDPAVAEVPAKPTMAAVVQQAIGAAVRRIVAHDPIVRLDLAPSGVHQARVSTRRLRSDLRTFEVVVEREWAEGLRDELKWLADALGAVRDSDVLGMRLQRDLAEFGARDEATGRRLLDHQRAERSDRLAGLLRMMASDRYFDLIDRLVAAAEAPAVAPGSRPPRRRSARRSRRPPVAQAAQ